jgi:hypothetical protein
VKGGNTYKERISIAVRRSCMCAACRTRQRPPILLLYKCKEELQPFGIFHESRIKIGLPSNKYGSRRDNGGQKKKEKPAADRVIDRWSRAASFI